MSNRVFLRLRIFALYVAWVALTSWISATSVAQDSDVLTQHNDNRRTGVNYSESDLTPSNVSWASFGRIATFDGLEGRIQAQPLVVTLTTSAGQKVDVLIVFSSQGHLYTFDVSTGRSPTRLLDVKLANSHERIAEAVATPVIDPIDRTYVYTVLIATDIAKNKCSPMHACSPCDREQPSAWPMEYEDSAYLVKVQRTDILAGSVTSASLLDEALQCERSGETIQFKPYTLRGRAGLLIDHSNLYAAFGSVAGHEGNAWYQYDGWVIAFDLQTLKPKFHFCVIPHSPASACVGCNAPGMKSGGGIWQSGNGLVADHNGRIYFQTGNGVYTNDKPGRNPIDIWDIPAGAAQQPPDSFESNFVQLLPPPTARSSDSIEVPAANIKRYQPSNYQQLERTDADLGSSGPVLLPDETLVGGGKDGRLYSLRSDTLTLNQEYQAFVNIHEPTSVWLTPFQSGSCTTAQCPPFMNLLPNLHVGPLFYAGKLYAWAEKDFLKAFAYSGNGMLDFENPQRAIVAAPKNSMPGGALSASANGGLPGTGIVWATVPEPFIYCDANGNLVSCGLGGTPCDALSHDVPGRFYAFAADTLELLYEDKLDKLTKFSPPTVSKGKVFVVEYYRENNADRSRLVVYGERLVPSTGPKIQPYWPFDVDGDGKNDFLIRDAFGYFSIYRSNGVRLVYESGFTSQFRTLAYQDQQGFNSGDPRYFPIDVNGDGKTDLLARLPNGDFAVWIATCVPNCTSAEKTHTLRYASSFATPYADKNTTGNQFLVAEVTPASKIALLGRNRSGLFDIWSATQGGKGLLKTGTFQTRFTQADGWDLGNRFFVLDLEGIGRPSLLVRNADGVFEVWQPAKLGTKDVFEYRYGFPSPYTDAVDAGGFVVGIRFSNPDRFETRNAGTVERRSF